MITGKYKYNPETGKVEKVSDDIPRFKQQVHFPGASEHSGHYFESLGRTVYGKEHKRQVMKEMGVAEL